MCSQALAARKLFAGVGGNGTFTSTCMMFGRETVEILQVVLAKKPLMNPAYNGRMKPARIHPGEGGDFPAS